MTPLRQTIARLAWRCVIPLRRRRLRNRSVSLVSNDCWSSFMYRFYHTPFNSPFVGLFIMPDDYLAILENPAILHEPLRMTSASASRFRSRFEHLPDYPLGILPGDIEIHFLHYKSADEALDKWTRRLRRLGWDNCIVKFSQGNGSTPDHLRRFDALPYPDKVAFTCRPYPGLKSVCALPEFAREAELGKYWKIADLRWNFRRHADDIRR